MSEPRSVQRARGMPGDRAGYETALDATLFNALETTGCGEALRFWEIHEPAVVVGRFGNVGREVDEDACARDDVPVMRRISGGGAVVVGPGCLNYSLVLSLDARPELRDAARSYQLVLGRIVQALAVSGLTVEGTSDVAWRGRKVSGNAQRRGRRALLHHGTVLYGFDPRLMETYLKDPPRAPAYRAGRGHAAFVANLPLSRDAIETCVAEAWDRYLWRLR